LTLLKAGEVFQDQFADNRHGWSMKSSANVEYKMEGGAYTVKMLKTNHSAWPSLGLLFPEDVEVQVDFMLPNTNSAIDWGAGIGLRSSERGSAASFYAYEVSATGKWGLYFHDSNNKWKTIKYGKVGSRVDPKKANTMRIVASGNLFTLYLNNRELARITDKTIPTDGNPKYVMLFASAPDEGTVEVAFRNFQVRGVAQMK
jgi:hypothetical protein